MNTQLGLLRRYEAQEVVALLNLKPSWLKRWVTLGAVPHQRAGVQRGVWFTYADIQTIGAMLPQLMSLRQANSRAEAGVGQRLAETPTASPTADPSADRTGPAADDTGADAADPAARFLTLLRQD